MNDRQQYTTVWFCICSCATSSTTDSTSWSSTYRSALGATPQQPSVSPLLTHIACSRGTAWIASCDSHGQSCSASITSETANRLIITLPTEGSAGDAPPPHTTVTRHQEETAAAVALENHVVGVVLEYFDDAIDAARLIEGRTSVLYK